MMRGSAPFTPGRKGDEKYATAYVARFTALSAFAIFAAGCGGDTSSSVGLGDDGVVSSPTFDFENDGYVVGKVRMNAPAVPDFLLRATLPVPRGTFAADDAQVPLAVISSADPTASPTQVEVVSRYANNEDGADVVEIISRVRRPDVAPGTPIEYLVVYAPHAKGDLQLSPAVDTILRAPGAVRLVANDPFGNPYSADLFAKIKSADPTVEVVRDGELIKEFRVPEVLVPTSPVTGAEGTLPRLMGVNAFVRTFAGEDFFALDLHVHNGFDGKDESVTWDEVLTDLYFDKLHLRLPQGWEVLHALENPFTGDAFAAGNMQEVPLIAAIPDGDMHLMHRQSQFSRRIMIARTDAVERARAELEHQTLAFCTEGRADDGSELWSWWNPATARYLPQNHRLPNLASMTTREAIDAEFRGQYEARSAMVETGVGDAYPILSGNLGWAHPYWSSYGGMTGGENIEQIPGVEIAWSGSQAGFRFIEMRNRMVLERQPTALYSSAGIPTKFEDHLVTTGQNGPYLPFDLSMKFVGDDSYFGFDDAPTFQADYVASAGLKPAYEEPLKEFMAIDLQHLIRFTNDLKTMTWLGNDSLSKWQIRRVGELFRMTHHEGNVGDYGYVGGSSLQWRINRVTENPGVGIEYGRGEGWGLFAASAAYATGDDDLRERFRPWFAEVSRVCAEGQSDCTGNLTAVRIGKQANGIYRTRQSFEQSFATNALESMRTTVFDRVDEEVSERLADIIVGTAYSTIRMPFYDPAHGGLRKVIGVGMSDMSIPDFCFDLPDDAGYGLTNVDHETPLTLWTYAYELSGDAAFLQIAASSLGTTANLEAELNILGQQRLPHSAFMLGTVQAMSSIH
ncbi:hypothetical protein [Planctomycetes bacterium Poly30]